VGGGHAGTRAASAPIQAQLKENVLLLSSLCKAEQCIGAKCITRERSFRLYRHSPAAEHGRAQAGTTLKYKVERERSLVFEINAAATPSSA
jgi:hypothetical protein